MIDMIELIGLKVLKRDKSVGLDRRAFERLYQQHKLPLLHYVVGLVLHQAVAEEIVQEAFLKFYRHRDEIDLNASYKSWLYTVARNLSFDYLKKKKEVLWDSVESEDFNISDNIEDQTIVPSEEQLIKKAEIEMVMASLENLPVTQREALKLWIDDLDYEDMAVITGKSAQAMKNLVHRAKQSLMAALKAKEE